MAISVALAEKAKSLPGVAGAPYRAIADALEVIPRTLVTNAGGKAIRTLTELRVSDKNHITLELALIHRPSTPRACILSVSTVTRVRWST